MTYYSRKIEMPQTRKEGLCNFVQMIINQLEAGKSNEALLSAVDLLDTLEGESNPFSSITSEKDHALANELERKHQQEMVAAMAKARADGIAEGETIQKRKLSEILGLAA